MSRNSQVPRSGRCPWGCVTVPPHGDWNLGLNNMIVHALCINVDVYLVWTFIIITMLYIQPVHSPVGSVPLWVQCPSCIWSSFWTVSWNGLGWCVSLGWSVLRPPSFGWGSDPCFHVPYLRKLHCVSGDLGHLESFDFRVEFQDTQFAGVLLDQLWLGFTLGPVGGIIGEGHIYIGGILIRSHLADHKYLGFQGQNDCPHILRLGSPTVHSVLRADIFFFSIFFKIWYWYNLVMACYFSIWTY